MNHFCEWPIATANEFRPTEDFTEHKWLIATANEFRPTEGQPPQKKTLGPSLALASYLYHFSELLSVLSWTQTWPWPVMSRSPKPADHRERRYVLFQNMVPRCVVQYHEGTLCVFAGAQDTLALLAVTLIPSAVH